MRGCPARNPDVVSAVVDLSRGVVAACGVRLQIAGSPVAWGGIEARG